MPIGDEHQCLKVNCGHKWRQIRETKPLTCPSCHSYKYDQPYTRTPVKKVEVDLTPAEVTEEYVVRLIKKVEEMKT